VTLQLIEPYLLFHIQHWIQIQLVQVMHNPDTPISFTDKSLAGNMSQDFLMQLSAYQPATISDPCSSTTVSYFCMGKL
jgi:hypothetical protein